MNARVRNRPDSKNESASVSSGRSALGAVLASGPALESTDGRYNILLLGGDAGADRMGTRPDTIQLASIDEDTGRLLMVVVDGAQSFGLLDVPHVHQVHLFYRARLLSDVFDPGFETIEARLAGLGAPRARRSRRLRRR